MRRRLTKAERQAVYDKCKGHCAYCGCEIPFKGFHVDHVKCLRNYEYMDELLGMEVDGVENMLPSCSSCNRYKSTYDLETFRKVLSGIPKRLARDVSTYNIAVRFNMIEEHNEPIVFYFERMKERESEEHERRNTWQMHSSGTELP